MDIFWWDWCCDGCCVGVIGLCCVEYEVCVVC